ncbi:MAG: SIR2 family protein [Anaerolineae bacterium]
MASQLKSLANIMQFRKQEGEPSYILILGAGASISSGSSSGGMVIEEVVAAHSAQDTTTMSWEDKVEEFYNILDNRSKDERYAILKKHIVGKTPSPGYRALAELIKAGYFNIILSTNYDTFLEDALSDAGLRARDFKVLINGEDEEEQIVRQLGFAQPRIKIVKLHGDLPARIFAFTPEEIWDFADKIENVLRDYLSKDIIINGHSMRDNDINRCIDREGGSIWHVNPSEPSIETFIGQAMRVRTATAISGELGYFDNFFTALRDTLLGTAEGEVVPPEKKKETPAPSPVKEAAPSPPKKEKKAKLSPEEITSLRKQLEIHKRNLSRLEERASMYGMDVPIATQNQIDYEKEQIAEIEAQLSAAKA